MKFIKLFSALLIALLFYACNENPPLADPQEITDVEKQDNTHSNESNLEQTEEDIVISELHTIVALEVLNSEKYVYVKAKESEKEYWLAAIKMPIKKGDTYVYSNGMIATNFKSKEHNRVFDQLVLVNKLTPKNEQQLTKNETPSLYKEKGNSTIDIRENGSIPIANIIENPSVFEGKKVKVQGECTKVNLAILNKNWVHLDDGTNGDYDFTVTTDSDVSVGDKLVMEGVLALNKDFGAGYIFPVILENCVVIQPTTSQK